MLPHQVNSTSSVQINFTLCDITSWTPQNLKYAFDTSGSTCFAYWASHVPVQIEENVTGEMIKPIVRYWLYIQIEENVTGEMIKPIVRYWLYGVSEDCLELTAQ